MRPGEPYGDGVDPVYRDSGAVENSSGLCYPPPPLWGVVLGAGVAFVAGGGAWGGGGGVSCWGGDGSIR